MKHYNIFALQGDTETTDQEVCDTLGLDPKLANTPEINEAAIKLMHRQNYDGYVARGIDPEEALNLADKKANETRSLVKTLMKE
jgi:hypothetical protein